MCIRLSNLFFEFILVSSTFGYKQVNANGLLIISYIRSLRLVLLLVLLVLLLVLLVLLLDGTSSTASNSVDNEIDQHVAMVCVPKALVVACRRPWYDSMSTILLQLFRNRQQHEEHHQEVHVCMYVCMYIHTCNM